MRMAACAYCAIMFNVPSRSVDGAAVGGLGHVRAVVGVGGSTSRWTGKDGNMREKIKRHEQDCKKFFFATAREESRSQCKQTTWHKTGVLKRDAPAGGCWQAPAASLRGRGPHARQADRQQHRTPQPQGAQGGKQRKLAGQQPGMSPQGGAKGVV